MEYKCLYSIPNVIKEDLVEDPAIDIDKYGLINQVGVFHIFNMYYLIMWQ